MSLHRNRVQMTVTGTPGTGTITLNAATSGYQSFTSAYGADATVDILITEGTSWEVARNCTYTNSGTTVTRGTFEASSSGSAVSFTSAAVVSVIATAGFGNDIESTFQSLTPGGRLTLESGVPVSTTDQTSKTTIYYTPYVHNVISLWNGSNWVPTPFTETSLALGTLTSGANYDVFGFLSSGVLALEMLVWTDNTTRATAVTLQDGRYCKSGDKTRLLLGTFRTTSTTETADSEVNRFVANVYNQVTRRMFSCPAYNDNSSVTSYTLTSTTWVEANGGSGARVNYVLSIAGVATIGLQAVGDPAATFSIGAGVGDNSATTAAVELLGVTSTRISASTVARFSKTPGFYFGALLLRTSGGTATIYADNSRSGGASDPPLTHIHGEVTS